ncbi:FecR family protein [Pseudozobellia thermophila]|uniref:FecR family protein n=1 Tax=Pseudozobellia thermophila TaxID=192903 RepID=A0A1M6KTX9_9FLAO|nr:FecR family protein [Pseudozobellia thermophila]SHJ62342.1 FecR family protein [Pseudozobellia thermophila]
MVPQEIENCIVRYLTRSGGVDDLNLLDEWLRNEENQTKFKAYVETHFAITLAMNDPNYDKVKDELLKEIRKERKPVSLYRTKEFLKYAAIALVFLGLGLLLKRDVFRPGDPNAIVPRDNAITLQLGNGEVKIISEDGSSQVVNEKGEVIGAQKGEQIDYTVASDHSETDFNTLTVPKGKRFGLVLSDGSKVHLNAGSSITYPTVFHRGKERRVVLVGEAYFEVSHDSLRRFVVNSQDLDVKVYGTKFNVSNYPEDEEYQVVLVDGSVSMSQVGDVDVSNKEMFLEPGFKGTLNKSDKEFDNQKVNTSLYTSWMQGDLVFRNETFENITRKLERHYNVVIVNNREDIAKERFNATIETEHETIEQVFNYFKKVYDVDYAIVENKIIINP